MLLPPWPARLTYIFSVEVGEKGREKEEVADSCCCCCLKRVFPYKKQVFHISLCRVCVSSRSCCCCCCCATSNRSRFLYQRRHRRYFSLHLLCSSSFTSSFSLDFYLFALACFTSLYSVGRDAAAVCCYFPDIVFPLPLPLSLSFSHSLCLSFLSLSSSSSTSSRICLPCIRPWRFVLFSFYILFIGFCVLSLLLLRLRFLHLLFFFLCSAVASVSPSFLALFSSCVQLFKWVAWSRQDKE